MIHDHDPSGISGAVTEHSSNGTAGAVHEHLSGGASTGNHVEFFDPSPGHRISAIQLPNGMRLGHDSAGHDILLKGHQVVLSHADVPGGVTKENGVLSQKAVEILRGQNFKVAYQGLQNTADSKFYMSVVS